MQLLQGTDADVREQAGQAITGLWKRQGLLGIPIYAGGHWTLLVLRRSGGSEFKMFQEEFVEVRYYESLQGFSEACWNVAEKVLKFILPTHSPKKGRANNTYQGDVIKCGAYVLHYWEGEVRQHLGQGWCVGRPFPKVIAGIYDRMIKCTEEIKEFATNPPKPAAAPKSMSKVKKIGADVAAQPMHGPRVPAPLQVWEYLAKEASLSLSVALVPFYGCSRCRFARGGCISWTCNPEKFQAHFEAYPEKYEGKHLRTSTWHSISLPELLGSPAAEDIA